MSPKATSVTLKKNCTKNCWFMTSCMSSCNWIYCFLNLWNMFVVSWRIWLCRWTKQSGLVPSWYLIPGKLNDCLGFEQRTGLSIEYSATDVLNIHRCIFPSHGHTGLVKLSNLIGLWYGCLQSMTKEEPRNQIQVQVHQWWSNLNYEISILFSLANLSL